MDFSLTDDQQLLRDTARKLLDRECPPALVRAHIDDPSRRRAAVAAPARVHRARRRPGVDLCLFLEETGYVAAPGPFLATALLRAAARAVDGVADRRRSRSSTTR